MGNIQLKITYIKKGYAKILILYDDYDKLVRRKPLASKRILQSTLVRTRGLGYAYIHYILSATALNIKRMVNMITRHPNTYAECGRYD